MALRRFESIPYIPMIGLKPAEMQALEELPLLDKQLMMPLFQIGTWGAANHLHSATDKLHAAYGDLPCFVTLADAEPPATERPVHRQIADLRNAADGYDAWCNFIEGKRQFVPALQISDLSQLVRQAERLHRLGRGLMILVERPGFPGLPAVANAIASVTNGGEDTCFMMDLGRANRDILGLTLMLTNYIQQIRQVCPGALFSTSASSFPDAFTAITRQEIYERTLFDLVRSSAGERLIYSDRGSARAERQGGGGGIPAPRVDYATQTQWTFHRSVEDFDRNLAYAQQARSVMASAEWDGKPSHLGHTDD